MSTPDRDRGPETRITLLNNVQAYLSAVLDGEQPNTVMSDSWIEFFRVYDNLLRRYARSRGMRNEDLDDCLQEVWVAVSRQLADFQRPQDRPGLRAWLYRLVQNKATDIVRRKCRSRAAPLDCVGDVPAVERHEDAVAEAEEARWQHHLVRTMLDELRGQVTDLNYRVLHLRLVEDCSISEVAETLELTHEQVRYRCHRMLKKLRSMIETCSGEQMEL